MNKYKVSCSYLEKIKDGENDYYVERYGASDSLNSELTEECNKYAQRLNKNEIIGLMRSLFTHQDISRIFTCITIDDVESGREVATININPVLTSGEELWEHESLPTSRINTLDVYNTINQDVRVTTYDKNKERITSSEGWI